MCCVCLTQLCMHAHIAWLALQVSCPAVVDQQVVRGLMSDLLPALGGVLAIEFESLDKGKLLLLSPGLPSAGFAAIGCGRLRRVRRAIGRRL